ncbi:NAD(P)-dependent oxidoreductase [Marinoscillum sp. MHG1-6]|uniref:NAD(P)-dependent oxidoreductase n=1 Tax=Marinoscillum sp. MHG1-6 TaxID=2959627 RepID=UPI0021573215|nr:NAD(P)-dependent oxidoreductase [Marinoscillum sp. MHG1-6]
MGKVKIGIIKEGKVPIDRRVALTPAQAKSVIEQFPGVELVVQSSEIRCFSDEDYLNAGIAITQDLSDCDIILGVKEVPIPELMNDKTYFFFSHTIKKQPYNRGLLQEILAKKITLIDYETLTNPDGKRIIAFGRWAGIVGAYNGIWTYGERYNLFHTRRAHECFDLDDLKKEFEKIKLPPIKILLTGGGRVAKGSMEVLMALGARKVSPHQFMTEQYEFPIFAQLNTRDYNKKSDGGAFSRVEFYSHPEKYESQFLQYAKHADILIASAFWDPRAPVLFDRKDVLKNDFKINIIADITCDIEGSIPSTKQPSTIEDPVYDYNPSDNRVEAAFTDEGNITVMAVDNLPCELPRDASESFGHELLTNVLPELLGSDGKKIIERATIAKDGALTEKYSYLQDYVEGK